MEFTHYKLLSLDESLLIATIKIQNHQIKQPHEFD